MFARMHTYTHAHTHRSINLENRKKSRKKQSWCPTEALVLVILVWVIIQEGRRFYSPSSQFGKMDRTLWAFYWSSWFASCQMAGITDRLTINGPTDSTGKSINWSTSANASLILRNHTSVTCQRNTKCFVPVFFTCDLGSLLLLVNPVLLVLLILLLKVVQVADVSLLHAHQAGQALHVLITGP